MPAKNSSGGYSISARVSEKGAVSLYGLQRFPVTLYADQLEAVLGKTESLRQFMKDNAKLLKVKQESSGGPQGSTPL